MKNTARISLITVLTILLFAVPTWSDNSTETTTRDDNLFLFGFGELSFHTLSVSGNKDAFEAGNPLLKDGFFSIYRASVFANGQVAKKLSINGASIIDSRIEDEYRTTDPSVFRLKMSVQSTEPLWDGWRFTGEGLYDPHRQWEFANLDHRLLTQPQKPARLELLARLESDDHGYVEGGSLKPSFDQTRFSLNKRSLFGIYADLHQNQVGAELVGGKLEGKSFREGTSVGIRANGTSGPFDLSHAPITRGSEEVKIEVRDRFDESTVISSRTLVFDIDYSVDYVRGRILLNQPVPSETINSDPVYIVITYDYFRTENDELIGARFNADPLEGISGGLAYLHRDIDDVTSVGVAEPEDLYAIDLSAKSDKLGEAYFEIARADSASAGEDFQALRIGFNSKTLNGFTLKSDFQRIDDQFRSFTNSDLDPVRNQQRLYFQGGYEIDSKQKVSAAFSTTSTLQPNGQFNNYAGEREEKLYSAGYHNRLSDQLGIGLKLERRDVVDKLDATNEDNRRQRMIVDVKGGRKDTGYLGDFDYGVHYELISFDDLRSGSTSDNTTNQVAVTLGSKPEEGYQIKLTQKMRLQKNSDLDQYDEREDGTFATVRIQPHPTFSTRATMEYKRFTSPGESFSLWQDDPFQEDRAGTFAVEYLPFKKFKMVGKVGRYEIERCWPDSTSKNTDDFLMGQGTYFATHHLSFDLESEHRRTMRSTQVISGDKTWDIGMRVNWNRDRLHSWSVGLIRRSQVREYPADLKVTSSSYILLAGGALSLGKNIFAQASIRDLLLHEPIDDEKSHAQVEVGYENPHSYRISLGYEYIAGEMNDYPDEDYTGHGLFLRLVGKL